MIERKRLIDRMYMHPPVLPKDPVTASFRKMTYQFLPQCQVIVADDVVKYYFEECDKEFWKDEDFPMLIPPFELMWVEGHRSEKIVSKECGTTITADYLPDLWGAIMFSIGDSEIIKEAFEYVVDQYEQAEKVSGPNWEACRGAFKMIWGEMFMEFHDEIQGPTTEFFFWVDKEGAILDKAVAMRVPAGPEREILKTSGLGMDGLIQPLLLTISFMNCKNVELVKQTPRQHFSKAHQRKHGRPLRSFHTIQVHPIKRAAEERQPNGERTGIVRAMRIWRGHFADYREGAGLFGKYHGRFFIPSHVRGSGALAPNVRYNVHSK